MNKISPITVFFNYTIQVKYLNTIYKKYNTVNLLYFQAITKKLNMGTKSKNYLSVICYILHSTIFNLFLILRIVL